MNNNIMANLMPKKVILDVDVGTDDYLALLMCFHAEKLGEIKIEAVVCTMGNSKVDNVCRNVVRLLEIVGRTDILVYRGASKQLIPPEKPIPTFHGSDGFADLKHEFEPDLGIIQKEVAAVAMRNLVVNHPGEISLICLAPLTNLALAVRLYDDFVPNIKDVWIMGGNYTAVGNVTAAAEYNFYIDPEAAYIVLDSITKPIHILTWETCLFPRLSYAWRFDVFGQNPNPAIQLLNEAERKQYRKEEGVWMPCDAFLIAAFLNPALYVTRTSFHNATVELNGRETRGQIVLDHLKKKRENVTVIEEIHMERFKELLLKL